MQNDCDDRYIAFTFVLLVFILTVKSFLPELLIRKEFGGFFENLLFFDGLLANAIGLLGGNRDLFLMSTLSFIASNNR